MEELHSYSNFHDTAMELDLCHDLLHDLIQNLEPLEKHELMHLKVFINACRKVLSLYDEGVHHGVIYKDGQLNFNDKDYE